MRFHVVSLPHTQTTSEFSSCAYTEKVRKFCNMMTARGHTVFLYAGAKNEAKCQEHISCMTETARKRMVAPFDHYTSVTFDAKLPLWAQFNNLAATAIKKRIQARDFICLIGGETQKPIADQFPNHFNVEFGVGYGGTFSKFRVFESYAWMHTIYGARSNNNPHGIDGLAYDRVINGYLEPQQFPLGKPNVKKPYLLYVGRLIDRKGIDIALSAATRANMTLRVAGPGGADQYPNVDYRGEVGPKERAKLMGGAHALLCPTKYIEPFGNVAIEAMACGTPVISSDWGAFTETVYHGATGYRCRLLRDYVNAILQVPLLWDRCDIAKYAVERWGTETIAREYENYFTDLTTLWDKGWYA